MRLIEKAWRPMEQDGHIAVGAVMNDTGKKARNGMLVFVAIILVVAFAIAGWYFFFLTPGKPEGQPSPHAIDQSASQPEADGLVAAGLPAGIPRQQKRAAEATLP